jgi:hypothetical protein
VPSTQAPDPYMHVLCPDAGPRTPCSPSSELADAARRWADATRTTRPGLQLIALQGQPPAASLARVNGRT